MRALHVMALGENLLAYPREASLLQRGEENAGHPATGDREERRDD